MSSDTPAEAVRRYRPDGSTRPDVVEVWPRIGGVAADLVMAASPPTLAHAGAWMSSLGHFLAWVVGTGLWEPESGQPVPLSLPVVDHYICARIDAGYRGASTIRSQLKRIGRSYAPNQWPYEGQASSSRGLRPPYSPAEQRALRAAALRLWDQFGDPAVPTVVAASLGAGLDTTDFRHARGTDLFDGAGGAEVRLGTPGRARTVPVADAWAPLLVEACAATGDGFMVGKVDTTAKNMMGRVNYQMERLGPQRLTVARARTTWLVDRLTAHVPPMVLMRYAGISSFTPINRALEFVPEVPEDLAAELMRKSVS